MKNHVSIEPATARHLPRLVDLFEAYRDFYGQAGNRLRALEFLSNRIRQKDSTILLALHRERPIGFAQCYPLFSSIKMKPLWLLNDLYVDLPYRRKGVGEQLIQGCKELAQSNGSAGLLLETQADNQPANQLYRKSGFVLDREHNYYLWTTPRTL